MRSYRPLMIAAGIVVVLTVIILLARPRQKPMASEDHQVTALPTPAPSRLVLFFPGDDGLLHREAREVFGLPASTPARARLVMEELLAGSATGLAPAFPWPLTVEEAFADPHGNVFIDLSSPPNPTVAGTSTELLLLFSAINSVAANCPGTERVQLLFGGREVKTLGHLDLSRPLRPSLELVAP
jgi:hypothetical protein